LSTAALYYTESGRDYWAQRGIPQEKLFIAYNALDTDKQIQVQQQTTSDDLAAHLRTEGLTGKKIVAFLGRLIAEKKPRVFIDAVAKAAARDPDIVGVFIGDGPEQQALEQYVGDNALSQCIRFAGAIYDEPTMAKYLMSSVAMVLPAFAGLAIQHAAVYGVPVILGNVAHSHGPEQEIVEEGKTGLWCPDEDVDAFAAAILRLVREPAYRDSLSANIKRKIDEKYNVARMAQGLIDAVHYCVGK
jgi:glycosyltransferase involved in cell wall biosynthesis